MELFKSHWITEGQEMHFDMPIQKVDTEKRIVSGFATLDNVDQQGDLVLAEASTKAFSEFRGNIREMHQPIAVGKMVNFREDSYYDPNNEAFYTGVYVDVYVSKGAQATWEKVIDGTLTGFSIGGKATDTETQFLKDVAGNTSAIQVIKAYSLVELSLVDSPANQHANVFSITKTLDGDNVMKGIGVDTKITNVFWCEADGLAKASTEETQDCLACSSAMNNIGWVESSADLNNQVQDTVTKFLRQKEEDATQVSEIGEGGVNMSESTIEKDVVTTETVAATEEAPVEEVAAEEAAAEEETAVAVDEVAVEEPDFEKMFDSLKTEVVKGLEQSKDEIAKAMETVDSKVAEVTKSLENNALEFKKSLTELDEKIDGMRSNREDVEKRLEILETSTAIKKSGDAEAEPEKKLQKSLWSGSIFSG